MTITNENALEREVSEQSGSVGSCLLWFMWGISISFMAILSLSLIILLVGSIGLNAYLGWELSGLEMSISRPSEAQLAQPAILPSQLLAAIPTNTPAASAPVPAATSEPALVSVAPSTLEIQLATLAAIATQAAVQSQNTIVQGQAATPFVIAAVEITPTPAVQAASGAAPQAVAIDPAGAGQTSNSSPAGDFVPSNPAPEQSSSASTLPAQPEAVEAAFVPPATSSNTYELIPIEGSREQRPAAEHGDLNLSLRSLEPIDVPLELIDIPNAGIDGDAINFGKIFPTVEIINAYTVHDWDWAANDKGALLKEDGLVLIGIKTNPGDPVFIPTKNQDIYDGKYFATVLYASADSLTFIYNRIGNVTKGYTVHYHNLHVDPNLLKTFEESKGNELPGLTLDTPVGWASDELIIAVRDNGTFLDARSLKDWWD